MHAGEIINGVGRFTGNFGNGAEQELRSLWAPDSLLIAADTKRERRAFEGHAQPTAIWSGRNREHDEVEIATFAFSIATNNCDLKAYGRIRCHELFSSRDAL